MAGADCLEDLKRVCETIPSSEVKLADGIRYQDVISAVEIMDPRTDAMCDHKSIRYITDLMHSGEILTTAELRELPSDHLLLFMQYMIALEARWLQGQNLPQTIFSTPYVHHMRFLQEQNPMMHVYCLAALKLVMMVFDTISEANVKENEEFLIYHFGLELHHDVPLEEVLEKLDDAHAEAMRNGWEQIAACFAFHTSFLRANSVLAKGPESIPHAAELLALAKEALQAVRPAEPDTAILAKLFHPMTLRWVPALTPLKWLQGLCVADGVTYFHEVITSLDDICRDLPDAASCSERLLSFACDFSASHPSLLARSRLLLLIHSFDANILESNFLSRIILNTLDKTYGCPLYQSVFDGDTKSLEDLLAMQCKKLREINKYYPQQIDPSSLTTELIRTQIADFLQRLARLHLFIIFIALNNRSRCRRRLANLFPELRNMQQLAWEIDTSIFGGGHGCIEHYFNRSRGQRMDAVCGQCVAANKSLVLSSFLADIVCRLIAEFNLLGLEIDLYGRNEMPTAYAYNEYIFHTMVENDSTLFHPQLFEPRVKQSARLYPLLLRTRRVTMPGENHTFYVEILQHLSNAGIFLHIAMQRLGVIPADSVNVCTTRAEVYALRYKSLQEVARPNFLDFEGYERLVRGIVGNDPLMALQNAVQIFQRVTERLNDVIPRVPHHRALRCGNLLSVARANSVSAKLLLALAQGSKSDAWTVEIQTGVTSLKRDDPARRVIASFPIYKLKQRTANRVA